ncbi:MinD-like ATPase involved in chromosome partitioning or flagellar assembly [Kribbella antiqua]|uniref:MinD-like ATPase involved in chromosome partitioning or flagellar assembly n=2 Tax=Kribbella antiqua TaxID=2512217 RepID=A0A4R2IYI7_9ACTN|nr:MinD-like ATPase involved in chromosome partitioning or flagellar assembly [Kribbella antiqua]
MLRRMAAEQAPAQQPADPEDSPTEAGPAVPPAPEQPVAPPQGPGYQQQPAEYQQPGYPPQGPPPPPYQPEYPQQQYPQYQPYAQEQYPQQGYPPPPPPPPYQPGPYDPQYVPPPPPPAYEQQPQFPPPPAYPSPPPGQVAPYQPAPYEQYPPPYQPYPPYEQQPQYQPPPYPEPQYQPQYPEPPQPQYPDQSYPPPHQQHPGQVYEQPPPPYQEAPPVDGGWGPAPTPQSDQIGTPMPDDQGDSVFRRFRRFASEAAYLVGASGRMQRDVDNIATIRRPIAIMRRVGVLSPVTEAGTSTVTALLSTMLATQRSDRVVAVDCDPGGAELSRRLEMSLGAGPLEGVTLVRSEGTADAVRTTLAEAQTQGARDVGLALVDCPGSMFDEVGSEMATSAHAAVLVVPSAQQMANYCLQELDQLPPEGQDVLLTRGVIVITMVENVDPGSATWLVQAFRQRGLEPVVLPYDAHIAQAWPLHSEELQAETRRALLDLAARVVETVTRTTS